MSYVCDINMAYIDFGVHLVWLLTIISVLLSLSCVYGLRIKGLSWNRYPKYLIMLPALFVLASINAGVIYVIGGMPIEQLTLIQLLAVGFAVITILLAYAPLLLCLMCVPPYLAYRVVVFFLFVRARFIQYQKARSMCFDPIEIARDVRVEMHISQRCNVSPKLMG